MPDLTHGPLVGATTDTSVCIWLRANEPAKVEIRLAPAVDLLDTADAKSTKAQLSAEHDYTAVLSFTDLLPDTIYHYIVLLNGHPALDPEYDRLTTFRTFPKADEEAGSFSFAFGSCFIPEVHGDGIFKNLMGKKGDLDPTFFLMIGDNVYVDEHIKARNRRGQPPEESLLALYREAYQVSWKHQNFRKALMQTPSYMIFDDHEFWNNWYNEIAHRHDQEGGLAGHQAYYEYQDSHNPDAANRHRSTDPTYHYTFSYGRDIGFFVLDCRMRRNPQATPYPTILGDQQRQALYQWLRKNNERYRLKFIVSSVPISFITLPHTIVNLLHGTLGDQWLGYPEERLELFKFIKHEEISGVHFLSGDIHLAQGLVIEPEKSSSGPIVYSYTSSPLANVFHLLPEQVPVWFSSVFWLVTGMLAGLLSARYLFDISSLWGLAAGLLGGAIIAWQWRQWQKRREPKIKNKPGFFEHSFYKLLRWLAHQGYMRKLMGVAADTISGSGIHYVPKNLFTAVHACNMGIVTIQRAEEDGHLSVQFKLVGLEKEILAQEKEFHSV